MQPGFSDHAWEDYLYWHETDRKQLERIDTLIEDIRRHPFTGIGKPEPLKHPLAGFWSRRIDDRHRLAHAVEALCDEFLTDHAVTFDDSDCVGVQVALDEFRDEP